MHKIFIALFGLASSTCFAQGLVSEYQDTPLNDYSNECATYRESRRYDVVLSRFVQTSALSQVAFLNNGDILLNRRVEDHLPYKKTPQLATVIYRYNADGSQVRYSFSSKSMQQQGLFFGALNVSENNRFAVSIADRATNTAEYRVVLLTDLDSKLTKEIFTQSRDDENLVKSSTVNNDGQVIMTYENGKRVLLHDEKKTKLEPLQQPVTDVSQKSERDFTGVRVSSIFHYTENMTYQTEWKRLSFMELGQEVGSIELNGCTLKSVTELSSRSARVLCDEGIRWLDLDITTPISEVNRNIIGYFPCK